MADNKLAELSEWDMELLEQELAEIVDIDMADFGFSDLDMEESAPPRCTTVKQKYRNMRCRGMT